MQPVDAGDEGVRMVFVMREVALELDLEVLEVRPGDILQHILSVLRVIEQCSTLA